MVDAGQVYLRHRSHVENINRGFPAIKQSFKGNFVELDFSENISELQSAHFSGMQYRLHCSIAEPENKKNNP